MFEGQAKQKQYSSKYKGDKYYKDIFIEELKHLNSINIIVPRYEEHINQLDKNVTASNTVENDKPPKSPPAFPPPYLAPILD